MTLSLDDFGKRVLAPQMAKLASQIDFDGLQAATLGYYTANSGVVSVNPVWNTVGTAGVTPGTSGGTAAGLFQYNAPQVYLNAGMMLDNNAVPRDNSRSCILNPAAHASSVAGLSGLFNPNGTIGEQYKKGMLGNALGFDFLMDQNINNLVYGATALIGGTASADIVNGASTIAVTGCGNNATVKAGAVFTLAGIYSVNYENQQSTGQLQQFVVTADTLLNGSGVGTLPIAPKIVLAGAGIANGQVNSLSANSKAVVWATGLTGDQSVPQNIAYHKDAFTFATADLEIPGGMDFTARETYDGISMRIVRGYDINNDNIICRVDVLGGFANLRPEMACRILG